MYFSLHLRKIVEVVFFRKSIFDGNYPNFWVINIFLNVSSLVKIYPDIKFDCNRSTRLGKYDRLISFQKPPFWTQLGPCNIFTKTWDRFFDPSGTFFVLRRKVKIGGIINKIINCRPNCIFILHPYKNVNKIIVVCATP